MTPAPNDPILKTQVNLTIDPIPANILRQESGDSGFPSLIRMIVPMRRNRIMTSVLSAGALALLAGCQTRQWTWLTSPNGATQTTTQDREDHKEYVNRVAEHNRRALGDDLDLVFQTDRPTRLTRWQVR